MTGDDTIMETLFSASAGGAYVDLHHQLDHRGSVRSIFVGGDGVLGELQLTPSQARRLAVVLTAAARIAEGRE